jgi:ACS family hexuronate transporter-like MFS transporter
MIKDMYSNLETGKYRYRILALLFMATTINYMDRSIIGVLATTLQYKVFGWTDLQYGYITASFQIAYGIGAVLMGAVIDRFGTRIGYSLTIGIWSFFGMLHAAVRPSFGFIGFMGARFGLGLGESGNFPACIKTVAEWFPKKERAFATGIFNAGSNVGAILAPISIPFIVGENGENWQYAFLITSSFSFIWLILWLTTYKKPEDHPKVNAGELAYIKSDSVNETTEKLPWSRVTGKKETWAFAVGKLTDAAWWFYLFWGGKYIGDTFHLSIGGLGLPLVVIYLLADGGSIGGGWISGYFIKKGWSINKSRKLTLLCCALMILPVTLVTSVDNEWLAISLIAIGAAGHQAWSANLFTLVSDVFPKKATASVVGIGTFSGSIAGFSAHILLGEALTNSGKEGYFYAFLFAGLIYLVCLGIIHLITPKLTPLDENLELIKE